MSMTMVMVMMMAKGLSPSVRRYYGTRFSFSSVCFFFMAIIIYMTTSTVQGFVMPRSSAYRQTMSTTTTTITTSFTPTTIFSRHQARRPDSNNNDDDDDDNNNNNGMSTTDIEFLQARQRLYESRVNQIRQTLESAAAVRQFRIDRGWVPETDPVTGQPVANDGKTAIALTAVVVAIGALVLRLGGRAALVSAVGLDMFQNPENQGLQDQLQQILSTAQGMDVIPKLALFATAWTVVKVACIDALGVALALASGLLFGGVIQGALASASAATFGSLVAFTLAKLDTPVRRQALQLLEDNPRLRGVEKVVAQDGLRAILTLRLAPILPIPIGAYNYLYACTNVPVWDFMGGIFLGSLKPYLLDSYLGVYVLQAALPAAVTTAVTDGAALAQTTGGDNWSDYLLLVALGASVLIGVWASQLATETWESVLAEMEQDKLALQNTTTTDNNNDDDDGIVRQVFGWTLPLWMVGLQLNLRQAQEHMQAMVDAQKMARDHNVTSIPTSSSTLGIVLANSPVSALSDAEVKQALVADLCDSVVLTPVLWGAFVEYSNPFYSSQSTTAIESMTNTTTTLMSPQQVALQERVTAMKATVQERIAALDERIAALNERSSSSSS
jgi:uncharacterized membrane protein YdjX (TVP38/TMEM64 family)